MKDKPFEARRVVSVAAGLALVVLLGACGGSGTVDGPPTPVPPTPTPLPPPSVVSTGQGSLQAGFVGQVAPFNTTLTGTLEATVDWTFASDDVDVYIARGACTPQQFLAGQCNIAAFSESVTAKPERVRLTGAVAGMYTLMIGNLGPRDESLSWQVVLTPTASSASFGSERSVELPEKARNYRGTVSW